MFGLSDSSTAYMGVDPQIRENPKMDGEPYEQMDDLGGFPLFWETPI